MLKYTSLGGAKACIIGHDHELPCPTRSTGVIKVFWRELLLKLVLSIIVVGASIKNSPTLFPELE